MVTTLQRQWLEIIPARLSALLATANDRREARSCISGSANAGSTTGAVPRYDCRWSSTPLPETKGSATSNRQMTQLRPDGHGVFFFLQMGDNFFSHNCPH